MAKAPDSRSHFSGPKPKLAGFGPAWVSYILFLEVLLEGSLQLFLVKVEYRSAKFNPAELPSACPLNIKT